MESDDVKRTAPWAPPAALWWLLAVVAVQWGMLFVPQLHQAPIRWDIILITVVPTIFVGECLYRHMQRLWLWWLLTVPVIVGNVLWAVVYPACVSLDRCSPIPPIRFLFTIDYVQTALLTVVAHMCLGQAPTSRCGGLAQALAALLAGQSAEIAQDDPRFQEVRDADVTVAASAPSSIIPPHAGGQRPRHASMRIVWLLCGVAGYSVFVLAFWLLPLSESTVSLYPSRPGDDPFSCLMAYTIELSVLLNMGIFGLNVDYAWRDVHVVYRVVCKLLYSMLLGLWVALAVGVALALDMHNVRRAGSQSQSKQVCKDCACFCC